MTIRVQCVCFDTTNPARLAAFWAEALGWRITSSDPDEVALEDEIDVLGLRVPFPPPSWDLAGQPRLRRFHLHYGDEVLGWARRVVSAQFAARSPWPHSRE